MMKMVKVSLGGAYQYGSAYRVLQNGTQALTEPSDASVGGVLGIVRISFGDFS